MNGGSFQIATFRFNLIRPVMALLSTFEFTIDEFSTAEANENMNHGTYYFHWSLKTEDLVPVY